MQLNSIRNEVGRRSFVTYVAKDQRRTTLLTAVFLFAAALCEGVSIATLFPAAKALLENSPVSTGSPSLLSGVLERVGLEPSLPTLAAVLFLGVLLKALLTWHAQRRAGYVVADLERDLRLSVVRNLLQAKWSLFMREQTGRVATAVGQEASLAATAYGSACRLLAWLLQLAVYLLIVAVVSPLLGFLVFVLGLLMIGGSTGFFTASRKAGQSQASSTKNLNSLLVDAIGNVRTIRAMAAQDHFLAQLAADAGEVNRSVRRNVDAREALGAAQEPMLVVAILLGLGFATYGLNLEAITSGIVGLVLFRASMLFRLAVAEYQHLVNIVPMFDSLQDLIANLAASKERNTGNAQPPSLSRSVEFCNLSFDYDEQGVIDQLNMVLPANRLNVLVGPSGTGKSTVLDLLLGMQQPREGRIEIDGIELATLDLESWRSQLGYVPQDSGMLHDTIARNITLGAPEISLESVERALSRAGASDFVTALPHGIHTNIGSHGSRLSSGQRQRVALARALVREPKLLILDEVTASLDPQTVQQIISTLLDLRRETTILAVTHQRPLVVAADRCYALSEGAVRLLSVEDAEQFGRRLE